MVARDSLTLTEDPDGLGRRLPRLSRGWRFAGRWRHGPTDALRFKHGRNADEIHVLSSIEERDGAPYYRVSVYRGVRERAIRAMIRKARADFRMQAAEETENDPPQEHVRSLWLALD